MARLPVYYPALTGLRAVAASMVFFFHFNPFVGGAGKLSSMTAFCGAVLAQGSLGVNLFFVLSGLLIATRYLDRAELSRAWAKQYFLKRFARIYPLYFILTALTFLAMAGHLLTWYTFAETATPIAKTAEVMANLTLTRGFFREFVFLGVPTAWSLTVEECFYISAPFLLLALRKRSWLLPIIGAAIMASGCLLTLIATRWHLPGGFLQPFSFMFQFTYFGRCVDFLAGIGLALWLRKRGTTPAPRGTTLLGIGLITGHVLGSIIVPWPHIPLAEWAAILVASVASSVSLSAGIAVLLYGLAHEHTSLQRLLQTKLFDLLGRSSYAFYLVHLGLFNDLLQRAIGLHTLLFYLVFNVIAILLYKLVEQPLHTAIRQRFQPIPVPAP